MITFTITDCESGEEFIRTFKHDTEATEYVDTVLDKGNYSWHTMIIDDELKEIVV